MARSDKALKEFLSRYSKVKPAPIGVNGAEEDCYVIKTEDCLFFMAESHLREIHNIINQLGDALHGNDYSKLIIAHSWDPPERGFDRIRIPVKVVESLDAKQAAVILRNLEGIQKDIDDGRRYREELQDLFGDTATIKSTTNVSGERVFKINGKLSSENRRRYAERYAEQVATNTLFDLAKALNSQLQQLVPDTSYGRLFVEGRDLSDRKIRYGTEVATELELTDDGAWLYTSLAKQDPYVKATLQKFFRQAMIDPFGLSLKHYMGKHNAFKAGKRPLVKVSGLSSFWGWLKECFGAKHPDQASQRREQ
jgi:hypothetical protein